MGYSVLLLRALLRRLEGARSLPRHITLESPIPALRCLVRIHRLHRHHTGGRFRSVPEGPLEHIRLHCIIHWHSHFHCAHRYLEALAPYKG